MMKMFTILTIHVPIDISFGKKTQFFEKRPFFLQLNEHIRNPKRVLLLMLSIKSFPFLQNKLM